MTNDDPTPPLASVETAPRRSWALVVPVLALILAAWFLSRAWDARGLPVTIHFEAGHGLKSGDGLRYRGITVGRIDAVRLTPDLGGVDVRLTLDESASPLARAGSRFWVVRPRIGTGGLDGLDTLLGARYIDVAPGPTSAAATAYFVGIEEPPVVVPPGALELVLEADTRGSVGRGAPVTWRRLEVGQVLSVRLSSDARHVLVRIAIEPDFAPLVLTNTRFFETSGLELGFGLDGLQLELESLETLLAGGIGFATPEEPAGPARTGQHFSLAKTPEDEWLAWRPALAVGHSSAGQALALPTPERAQLSFESGLFNRDHRRRAWVLWTSAGLVGPSDVVHAPSGASDEARLEVSGASFVAVEDPAEERAALLPGLTPPPSSPTPWPAGDTRTPERPEDALAIGDRALAAVALDAASLGDGPLPWKLDPSLPLDEAWHGAPVVSRADGKLIGLLVIDDTGSWVVELPAVLLTRP